MPELKESPLPKGGSPKTIKGVSPSGKSSLNGSPSQSLRSWPSATTLASSKRSPTASLWCDLGPERPFSPDFVIPPGREFECPVCGKVLRYPVIFKGCGHHCCSRCLSEILRVEPRCPVDQVKFDRNEVSVDEELVKKIDALEVFCSLEKKGCTWRGPLGHLMAHVDDCGFVELPCPLNCQVVFERRFVDKHKAEDCPKRHVLCQLCDAEVRAEDELNHMNDTCLMLPLECRYGCGKTTVRRDIRRHEEEDCPKQPINCPFEILGCTYHGLRMEAEEHIRDSPEVHLNYVIKGMTEQKKLMDAHTEIIRSHNQRVKTVERRVDMIEAMTCGQIVWKIDNYQERFDEARNAVKTTIYSPPFYTSRHGYKLVASVCLYGEGKVRGEFMSVFICICKGEYDPLLRWPFSPKVTFTLLDQCPEVEGRRNITYTIKPHVVKENTVFLGRPTMERNAAFGGLKFVGLDTIITRRYIQDNAIYIKIRVDGKDIFMV